MLLADEIRSLADPTEPLITALSNTAALLYQSLENINWCGFYLFDGKKLVLGPFGGKPACTVIPMGKGVCGTAAAEGQIIRVPDVNEFPGHIACDPASQSEIVLPLILNDGRLLGVLDIDAPIKARFNASDEAMLKTVRDTLMTTIDAIVKRVGRVDLLA